MALLYLLYLQFTVIGLAAESALATEAKSGKKALNPAAGGQLLGDLPRALKDMLAFLCT